MEQTGYFIRNCVRKKRLLYLWVSGIFFLKMEFIMNICQLLFSTFGLFLDLIGVLLLIIIPTMAKGTTTEADEKFVIEQRLGILIANSWFQMAIMLIIIGFAAQIVGNIIALVN